MVVILLVLSVWLLIESGYGLLQLIGLCESGSVIYPLTGSFSNPGPYGGFLAVCLSCVLAILMSFRQRDCLSGQRWIKTFVWVSLFAGLVVLPATMSRAAWASLVMAALLSIYMYLPWRGWVVSHKKTLLLGFALALLACVGAFLIKKDSALGRLHIWHMEIRAIAARPMGHGPYSRLGAYGEAQHDYFLNHDFGPDAEVIGLAGCPEYAFNEYLGLGIEAGLLPMLLCVAAVVAVLCVAVRRANPFGVGLLAWSVFAFFSYPMNFVQMRLLLALMVLASLWPAKNTIGKWTWPARVSLSLAVAFALYASDNYFSKHNDYREVYQEAYMLYGYQDYAEALELFESAAPRSSDPMFRVMMGRCKESLGQIDAARQDYLYAHYMVPCRLYPLVRLMRLELRNGGDERALELGEMILGMELNEKHGNMVKLHQQTRQSVDSLKLLLR